MKLPNGYGSIIKLSGKRRKPYNARITIGSKTVINKNGEIEYKQNRISLGCFKTKAEALRALEEYNTDPYNLTDKNMTFSEIYEMWKRINYDKLKTSAKNSRDTAYRYCERLYDIPIRNIKLEQLQQVVDACEHGSSTKKNIKTAIKTVYDTAIKNDIISKDMSQYIVIEASEPLIDRIPFSDSEISLLWDNSDKYDYAILLILLYSGMRVNELLKNTKSNVNLDEHWIYVPKELAKNKSSIRYVPIHDKIYPLIKKFYDRANNNLITSDSGYNVMYNNFVSRNLKQINAVLGSNHRFHDTRHTFITRCHFAGLDDLIVKKIVGHTPDSITAKVYTHIDLDSMYQEINKLDF